LDRFDALISKIIFKKIKKHHFNAFRHEKHFEKQPQPHSQTGLCTSLFDEMVGFGFEQKKKGKQKRKHQNDIVLVYGQNNTSYSLCI